LTAFSEVAFAKGMYSIHMENLSIRTKTHLKLPGAGLNGPIMSSPQHANGHEAGMVWICEQVRESSWQRTDNPHNVLPTFWCQLL
jgi:hypothetical protein